MHSTYGSQGFSNCVHAQQIARQNTAHAGKLVVCATATVTPEAANARITGQETVEEWSNTFHDDYLFLLLILPYYFQVCTGSL